jgi:hypothetical protein
MSDRAPHRVGPSLGRLGRSGAVWRRPTKEECDGRVGLYAGFCDTPQGVRRPSISAYRRRHALAAYPQARTGRPRTPARDPFRGPFLALLRVGFTEPSRSPGMLVGSYPTVSPLPLLARSAAVCFLWHCPAGRPGLPLTTTLPCGARTFLGDEPEGTSTRPPDRLVRRACHATTR